MSNNTNFSKVLLSNNSIFFQRLYQIKMTISKSYYHTLLHTILLSFSISTIQTLNYTNIFRELLPNNGKHFFQTLYQTIVALSEPLQNNTTLFRINFKQYIQGELLSNNNGFFQILYQTMTFPEGFYKICHTPEFISANYWN